MTLDDDVTKLVEDEIHRTGQSLEAVVNDSLRRSLSGSMIARSPEPYRVRPHKTTLLAGLDRGRFNSLTDELEDRTILATRTPTAPAKRPRRPR